MLMGADPPFRFDCHRCGHCCRVGHGRVWIEEAELPHLAAARSMSAEAFTQWHVVRVGRRLSLREGPNGSCSLLEGLSDCSVYESRPEQCRSFPFWPAILDGGDALLAASDYCPGIELLP